MNVSAEINKLIKEKTCIVGIGNYLMKDDAVGLYIIDELKKIDSAENVHFLNAGDVIENYIYQIADGNYKNVIILDAVKTGYPDGIIFGNIRRLSEISNNFSTHKITLGLSAKILEHNGMDVYFLGVEVNDAEFGDGLSAQVRKRADHLIALIRKCVLTCRREVAYGV